MTTIMLHDFELDERCYRVRLLLSLLGLSWQREAVDSIPGEEERKRPLLALNPFGRLPILADGDRILHGTSAILCYLAHTYDEKGTWLPGEPGEFGRVMMWLDGAATEFAVADEARKQALFGVNGVEAERVAACRHLLRIVDDHLTHRGYDGATWMVGDHPTLADLALFPSAALSRDYGVDHDEYPALRRWIRRFRTLDGFVTMPGIPDYH